jgi:hypothetical protein
VGGKEGGREGGGGGERVRAGGWVPGCRGSRAGSLHDPWEPFAPLEPSRAAGCYASRARARIAAHIAMPAHIFAAALPPAACSAAHPAPAEPSPGRRVRPSVRPGRSGNPLVDAGLRWPALSQIPARARTSQGCQTLPGSRAAARHQGLITRRDCHAGLAGTPSCSSSAAPPYRSRLRAAAAAAARQSGAGGEGRGAAAASAACAARRRRRRQRPGPASASDAADAIATSTAVTAGVTAGAGVGQGIGRSVHAQSSTTLEISCSQAGENSQTPTYDRIQHSNRPDLQKKQWKKSSIIVPSDPPLNQRSRRVPAPRLKILRILNRHKVLSSTSNHHQLH